MKKYLFMISLALIVVSKLNAQIEEVSAEQYAPKKENITKAPIDYLSKASRSYGHLVNQRNAFHGPLNLMGQQLYCITEKSVITELPIVAMTISQDGTIGLKKLKKGTYYNVTNIICTEEEYNEFVSKVLAISKYSDDTIHYYDSNKEKIYKFQFKSSKSAAKSIGQLLKPTRYETDNITMRIIYELTDADGLRYYIAYGGKGNRYNEYHIYQVFTTESSEKTIAAVAYIGDFISVDTYNYVKTKYEKKDVVSKNYYRPTDRDDTIKSEEYVYHIEKVGIDNEEIVLLSKQLPNYDNVESIIYEKEVPSSLGTDTLYSLNQWYFLRTEVDSILDKEYQKEVAQKAAAREEKAKQKEEYVKKYGEKFAEYIIENKVCAGMTKEMCKISMGTPDETSKSSNAMGVVETWTYSRWYPFIPYTVVTFLNNKVTSVDEYESSPF